MSIILSEEEKAFLRRISEILTPQQKQVFRAKILGLKQKETAFILGISQQMVSIELRKARKIIGKRGANTH